jgi:hypothetical protein
MKLFITLILGSLLSLSVAQARIIKGASLKLEGGVAAWNGQLKKAVKKLSEVPAEGIMECREAVELSHTFVCLSFDQRNMNLAFMRASYFVERSQVILSHDDYSLKSYIEDIGGHDLKGQDLLRFYEASKLACEQSGNDKNICLNNQERELFEEFLLPEIKQNPNFVVITYAVKSSLYYESILSHEILHAQYFTQPKFQAVVDKFWAQNVSDPDKRAIKKMLSSIYDVENEYVLKNEFQAYVLQVNATTDGLGRIAEKYQVDLLNALKRQGLRPIGVL